MLTATSRTRGARQCRRDHRIPAILYGHGIATAALEVDERLFDQIWRTAQHTVLVRLAVDGKNHHVLIKAVQRHPVRDTVLHVDFYQVRMDEKVRAAVPVVFTGVSPAVKDHGGIFLRNLDKLLVEALPQYLPRELPIDISALTTFDAPLRVAAVPLPAGVTALVDSTAVVCLVQRPRSEEELKQLEEAVNEDIAAVEGIEKKEPAEGEILTEASDGQPLAPAAAAAGSQVGKDEARKSPKGARP